MRAAAGIPIRLRAAHLAVEAGADGITAHLREDRRHISDEDIARLKGELTRPLNLEMAATDEMLAIALRHLPNACCLVPERREERTTEGGLDVAGRRRAPCSASSATSRLPASASRCSSSPTQPHVEAAAAHRRRHRRAAHRRLLRARARGRRDGRRARARAARSGRAPRRSAAGLEVHAGPRAHLRHGGRRLRACRRSSSSTSATSSSARRSSSALPAPCSACAP